MPHYTQISAEFELVTPAFIGSAYPDKVGCIDPKAVKAALRYWWRVTHWADFAKGKPETDAGNAEALAAMHAAEMRLFGGVAQAESKDSGAENKAKSKNSIGQGMLQIVVKNTPIDAQKPHPDPKDHPFTSPGISYLIGQGLRQSKESKTLRAALQPGKFTVQIIARHIGSNELDATTKQQIHTTVRAFGLLGGLGGRQNRGFGRVVLRSYKCGEQADDWIPKTPERYIEEVEKWFGKSSKTLPPIPAQTGENLHYLVIPKNGQITVPVHKISNHDYKNAFPPKTRKVATPSAWKLLDTIGEQFLLERSWGKKTDGRHIAYWGVAAEQNYKYDHDWIKNPPQTSFPSSGGNNPAKITQPPYRSLFGLPYGFGGKSIAVELKPRLVGRRASPVCIHITLIDGKPIAVLYALKSRFLPKLAKLKIGNQDLICVEDLRPDWDVVQNFFNRFDPNITARKPVPKTKP